MAGRILYATRFFPDSDKGGGARRVRQVLELLGNREVEVLSAPRRDRLDESGRQSATEGGRAHDHASVETWWSPERRPAVRRLRAVATLWSRAAGLLDGVALALVDDPVYFGPLLDALEGRRIPVAAICHNLETLVPSQVAPRERRAALLAEVAVLRRCGLVVTISREETVVLRNLGAEVLHLPYHPTSAEAAQLRAVRRRRQAADDKRDYLALGSAGNRETAEGLVRLEACWRSHGAAAGGRLLLAGYGTEKLPASGDGPGEVLRLGALSAGDLDALLSTVRAAVCHQERGAGALTRITDFLLAGVPVVATEHAARSYYGTPGLTVVPGLADLPVALTSRRGAWESPPSPPTPDQEPLLEALRVLTL